MSTKYLINEPTFVFQPSLVKAVGFNRAVMIQQVYFWTMNEHDPRVTEFEGRRWVRMTYEEMAGRLYDLWKPQTLRKNFMELRELGVIDQNEFNRSPWDHTQSFTVNFDGVNRVVESAIGSGPDDENDVNPVDLDQTAEVDPDQLSMAVDPDQHPCADPDQLSYKNNNDNYQLKNNHDLFNHEGDERTEKQNNLPDEPVHLWNPQVPDPTGRLVVREIERVGGIAPSPFMAEQYRDLAIKYGWGPFVVGLENAAKRHKTHIYNYVRSCVISAYDSTGQGENVVNGKKSSGDANAEYRIEMVRDPETGRMVGRQVRVDLTAGSR